MASAVGALLPSSERASGWSPDGRFMIYSFRSGGGTHVGVLNLADRSKRPLTHSPGVDDGAEWTPDKTILFSRHQDVSRIFTADLTKLLASPQQ